MLCPRCLFFFNDTATTEIYTLSLHDALPICLPWVAAVAWIVFVLITSVTERTTAIEPISVPKSLAESGYTPDVAAQRLRDAMNRYAKKAINRFLTSRDSEMKAANI